MNTQCLKRLRCLFFTKIRKNDYGNMLSPVVRANFGERFRAIHMGHLQIKKDDVWFEAFYECYAAFAVVSKLHFIPVRFKFHAVHLIDNCVVFNDGYLCHYPYHTTFE